MKVGLRGANNVKIIIYSKIVKLILRLTIFILNILFVRKKYPHNGGPISKSTSNSATISMFIKHYIAIYTRKTQSSVNSYFSEFSEQSIIDN